MKIEICEDNGFMNDGKPTLVILLIDGTRRVPYPADKTIQQLYEDVAKMGNGPLVKDNFNDMPLDIHPLPMTRWGVDHVAGAIKDYNKIIQREDIVKCIKAYGREGNNDLVVGNEYRVIDIEKVNGQVYSYEVIDDNAPIRYRISVAPEEIELLRKAPIQPPKNNSYRDIIKKCECGEQNALVLTGDKYVGKCSKCGCSLIEHKKEVGK